MNEGGVAEVMQGVTADVVVGGVVINEVEDGEGEVRRSESGRCGVG